MRRPKESNHRDQKGLVVRFTGVGPPRHGGPSTAVPGSCGGLESSFQMIFEQTPAVPQRGRQKLGREEGPRQTVLVSGQSAGWRRN